MSSSSSSSSSGGGGTLGGTIGAPLTPGSTRRDDLGKLQRKLQRSYTEKNMLLAEIQKLKEQVQGQGHGRQALPAADQEREQEHWNRLLEANVRSGTMACMWCIKMQVLRMQALAFNKWKTRMLFQERPLTATSTSGSSRTSAQKPSKSMLINPSLSHLSASSSSTMGSPNTGRRDILLQLAQGIITKSTEKSTKPQTASKDLAPPMRDTSPPPYSMLNASATLSSNGRGRSSVGSASSRPVSRGRSLGASPLQSSYAEFLQQRRLSVEVSKQQRRRASASPPNSRQRSSSRGASPSAPRLKPSYMGQTSSSRKKVGSPTHTLQQGGQGQGQGQQTRGRTLLPATYASQERNASYSTSAYGNGDASAARKTLSASRERENDGANNLSSTPGASSVAASESMHVQDMSLGNIGSSYSYAYSSRQQQQQQQQHRPTVAPQSGQSKSTVRSSSAGKSSRPIMYRAQARLLFDDLHALPQHKDWSQQLRGAAPKNKKPALRI